MHRPLDKAFWRLKCAAEGLRGRAYEHARRGCAAGRAEGSFPFDSESEEA